MFASQVLFHQFKYFFNLYFLLLACSQFINELRLGELYTYWVPLVCDISASLLVIVYCRDQTIGFFMLNLCSWYFIWRKYSGKQIISLSAGSCFGDHRHKRGSGRNKMLPPRQRSELSDLQQAFDERWGIAVMFCLRSYLNHVAYSSASASINCRSSVLLKLIGARGNGG